MTERRITLPWDYSVAPIDGEAAVPNIPTTEGRLLGTKLARLADLEELRIRSDFPQAHSRCNDCALRAGTDPNGCVETLMDLLKCVCEDTPFYCHQGLRDGEPKRLCAGFAILAGNDEFKAVVSNEAPDD